ncbi:MFS transporter [Streptomyces sp. TLI_171]|uniref:MFS transporter n=1 Tax=Streptomyces sp. TLI_171 TaxID=1938859 RepID=UPI000C5850DB|nr:MFS transporter [Streptomyces sp. TLI_171]RKE22811.1 putative MFS family arabinose efflux permease [Streptomyces sp. TLI_171]
MTAALDQHPARPAGALRRRIPELLHEPAFRRYWTGQTVSSLGDQITLLVIPLIAVSALHADAAQMGYLAAAGWLPYLLLSLHAGGWADRYGHRRRVMIATDLGRAAVLLTVPIAFAAGVLTLAQLYAVVLLTGTLSVFFHVCNPPLFVALVPAEQYLRGNALINGSRAVTYVAGPGLGGLLVQLLAAPLALVVDAASFLVSALFLRRISPEEPPPAAPGRGSAAEGLRWIRRSPVILAALLGTATVNLFTFVIGALFVLYATEELGFSAGLLGAVMAAAAVGTLLGAAVTGRLAARIGVGPAFLLGLVAFPAPLLLIPLAGGSPGTAAALLFGAEFLSGVGVMILDITAGTIFAACIPDALRSRVSGAYQAVNYGVRPVGSLLGGLLGSTLGLRPALWIAAVGALASGLWVLFSPIPRLRELPGQQD